MSLLGDLIAKGKGLLNWEQKAPTETEAIKRNTFDRNDWEHVLKVAPAIQAMQAELEQTIDYAADFMGDLHAGLFKAEPTLRSAEEMTPTHVANRAVMEQLLGMREMAALRQHSKGDKYGAASAMMQMQDVAVQTLTKVHAAAEEAAEQEQARQEARQQALEAIQQQAKDLQENPPPAPLVDGQQGPQAPPDGRVDGLKTQMDQFASMPAPSNAGVQQAAQSAAEGASHNLRVKAAAVTDQLDGEKQLMTSFGVEPGELQRMGLEERIELARRLSSNRMAEFAKLIGQFKMIGDAESRKRVVDAPSEIYDIELGGDLTRMTSSERLNLADESLEDLMWARWQENQLSVYAVRGKERQGQGPIIVVCDESTSMTKRDVGGNSREAWSKALSLALCDQAKRRKRDFIYIGFASAGQQHVVKFIGGQTPIDAVVTMTEHFFNGGTNFEQPLTLALKIMEEDYGKNKPKPDVVFITDDEYGSMDQDFMHEWHRVKDLTSMHCYGIAIGCSVGGALNAVSDNVREITELVNNPRVMGDLFRTI